MTLINTPVDEDQACQNVARLYDDIVDKYVELFWNDPADLPWLQKFVSRVSKNGTVLDVGCGPGNCCEYMVQNGLAIHGIDFAPKMIEVARKLVPNQRFDVMDCRKLSLPDEQYDGALAAYAIPHLSIEGALECMREIYRVLKPGGVAALTAKEGVGDHLIPVPLAPGEEWFVHLWNQSELVQELEKIGFTVLEEARAEPTSSNEMNFVRFLIICRK